MEYRVLESSRVFEGRILRVRVDRVEVAPGVVAPREVVEHAPGVCVLPVDAEGMVYLVRQYRHPFAEELLEAPAGMMEEGETPVFAAARELREEIGAEGELISLGEFLPTPGYCDEQMFLFLARVSRFGETAPDEDEFLQTVSMPFSEFYEKALNGALRDGRAAVLAFRAAPYLKD
ncbi:MAG: NUDIX hydrolase [Clostridia bacterium]|nr:NUDIX hydrolase [Clostridia bacterium]